MTATDILHTHPLVDEILDAHHDHCGGDEKGYTGYRGHVYRVLNFTRALSPDTPDRDDRIAISAAFHDLDAFSSLDYLAPSIRTQDEWLRRTGREAWADELAVIIAEHHRLTRYKGGHAELAEAFRRADLVDVSFGLIRFGLDKPFVREVRRAFDVKDFFTRVVPKAMVKGVVRHPLDPLPFLRARRALGQAGHDGADR